MNFDKYEREEWTNYAALASTIASILRAAIGKEKGYRLQQVTGRAKQPASLYKKLEMRGLVATTTLENDIKDLAGCRVIFYTNNDVTKFLSSGVIDHNFEVLDSKIHQPRRETEDATELYISNHFIVKLRPERIILPEYSGFAGMRCEIQIHTILNHAWAEMAHDTIYKVPDLRGIGGRELEGIKNRLQKVARKYLVPAGYEFQKIASDFQRIIDGKALFDNDALEVIVEAADNNVRAEAIEAFADSVLPLYDDLQTIYPEVVTRLVQAADRARSTPPVIIETPYGALPAKTYKDIVKGITAILIRYRYFDVRATFEALLRLYAWAANDDERKPLVELGEALAKHQIHVWRQHGPIVQVGLIDLITTLSDDERCGLGPLLVEMLGEILSTEVSGTTNTSNTVTFYRGSVVVSDELRIVRTEAINLLKNQFKLAKNDDEQRSVLGRLQAATRLPFNSEYSNELACIVMEDMHTILEFQTEIANTLSLELLQTTEAWVHDCYEIYHTLPQGMYDDSKLVAAQFNIKAAALAFRDVVNANTDFVIYKTLVGFNSVYPPAWEDMEFDYEQANVFRAEQVNKLLESIDETSAEIWFDRISRYARTKSNDAATFPVFANFLERLAETQPTIIHSYINRLDETLANFLPSMLIGLMRSAQSTQTSALIDEWLNVGVHLNQLTWYLRFADPFDEVLFCRSLESAIRFGNRDAVRNVLRATAEQFTSNRGTLIENVFLPALRIFSVENNFSWVRMHWFSWLNKPIIRALDEEQASIILNALVPYPELSCGAEHIAAAIAERWPAKVVAFIGERQAFSRSDSAPPHYDAVPYSVHELQTPLAAAPNILLEGARTWFETDPQRFSYHGGKLLTSVFPDLSGGLEENLAALISGGNEQDLEFVLSVLAAFEAKSCIFGLLRNIIAALEPDSRLLHKSRSVLFDSGVVRGEFGYVDLFADRKARFEVWLADPAETVRQFATDQIRDIEKRIAEETRSAEASIALRKLNHDEEVDD